ncbi:aldehyde dehydrogenase family protein, partial [Ilumatobacter sp.]|nr:aldehyde dehydrogenase family protein [Ilumatobacter sp.]
MAADKTFDDYRALAAASIRPFADAPLLHFIHGRPAASASGETFANNSPVDATLLGSVALGDAADIDAAANAAHEAFADWSGRSGKERKKILHRVADLIESRADDIAAVECVDTGQTIRFMSAAAIRGAENFRFFADHAPDANNGRSMPDEHHVNFSSRRALGPVGVITPWN